MASAGLSTDAPERDNVGDSASRHLATRLLSSPEWFYLIVAIPFGIGLLLLTPPIQSPDEDFHLFRAYQLSEGGVVAVKRGNETGGELPVSLVHLIDRFAHLPFCDEQKTTFSDIRAAMSIHLNTDDRKFIGFSTIAVQPPLGHLPQAIGLLLTRQVTHSALVGLYVGRLFNLLAAVAIAFWAIRRTPVIKWGFVAIALLPMTMFLAASLSSDALTNALTSLFVAEICRAAFGQIERLTAADICRLAVLGIITGGLIKQSFFPLAICFLMIPIHKLGSVRRYAISLAIVLFATLASTAAWGNIVREIYSPGRLTQGINPQEQLELIRSDPGSFVKILGSSLFYQFRGKVRQFVGVLGWGDVSLPSAARNLDLICLALLFLVDFNPRTRLRSWQVLIALTTSAMIGVLIMTVLHLTWNPVGFPYARFQGRYFIPIAPLIGIAFSRLGGYASPAVLQFLRRIRPLTVTALPGILLVSMWCVYQRYYIDSTDHLIKRHLTFAITRLEQGEALDDARSQLRDALQLTAEKDRSPVGYRQMTCLLEARDSADAAARLAALGSTSRKGEAALSLMLGKILTANGDYADALAHFENANKLIRGNETAAFALWNMQDFSRKMKAIHEAVLKQTPFGIVLLSASETDSGQGACRALMKYVVTEFGGSTIESPEMVWRCHPASGEIIRVDRGESANASDNLAATFFACSATLIPHYFTPTMDKPFPIVVDKRVFIFPAPINAVLLNDEQISWYYQRRMTDLTDEERERELAYRAERHLTFPLSALPE